MSLEMLDCISPKITFYYKGRHRHNSQFGGILTIIMVIIVFSVVVYYFSSLLLYINSTSFFYKKYENDVGYYPLKPSYLSHYIYIYENQSNYLSKFDFKSIRIMLIDDHELYDSNPNILEKTEHWLYDQYEIENTSQDIQNMQNSIFIKYYYNPLHKKYYSRNDSINFKYPYLKHGMSNPNNTNYGTIIEKCSNISITKVIFGECNNEKEINKYLFNHNKIKLKISDNQIDLSNLKNPIQSLFYELNTNINIDDEEDYYIYNIYYHPLLFKTHQYLLIGKINEVHTFGIDKTNIYFSHKKNKSKNILLKYTFSIQNLIDVYERKYENLLDILPKVGGFIEIIYYIFYYVNFLYNRYILVLNTQELYLQKDAFDFFRKQKKIFKKRKRIILKQHLFNSRKSYNTKLSFENQKNKKNTIINNNEFITPLKLNIFKSKINKKDILKKRSGTKDFEDFSSLPLFTLKNNQKMSSFANNNFIEDIVCGKNDKNNIIIRNDSIERNVIDKKTVSLINKKSPKKYFNSLNTSVVKKIQTTVNKKENNKTEKIKENRISFCDIFTSENYPMLEYFNLNKKGITMDQCFFSKEIKLKNYLYYFFSFKRHISNIKVLEKFHTKLLSEEYLYHSHILLYVIYKKVFKDNEQK